MEVFGIELEDVAAAVVVVVLILMSSRAWSWIRGRGNPAGPG